MRVWIVARKKARDSSGPALHRCLTLVNPKQKRAPTGEVRVIGGSLKRSKLPVPDRPGLRPTPDRVRETLFNWLAPVIEGARVLDLCAGSGVLGIEAVSRGARHAQINEPDRELADLIAASVARLKIAERVTLTRLPAERLLAAPPAQLFDLVFVDPPYAAGLWQQLLAQLGAWLAPGACVYLEHPLELDAPYGPEWRAVKQAQAGRVRYLLLEHAPPSASLIATDSPETAP